MNVLKVELSGLLNSIEGGSTMEIEELKLLIDQGVSYEEIGRRENVTGAAIKKRAKKAGIYRARIKYNGHNGIKKVVICAVCPNEVKASGRRCCSRECSTEYGRQQLLGKDFDDLGLYSKKTRVILEQGYKCNRCGISDWLGAPLTLELEHIDGNHHNNDRTNLEVLCPNCHAQTPSWRGRNRNKYTGA